MWPFLRIVYTGTIVGICVVNILINFFSNISTVSGYITGSITSHLSSRQPNKKSALGTWRLVEMPCASQVHRWIGIDQTYQTLDLDTRGPTRGYVFERGLDADAEAQQNQRLHCFLKSDLRSHRREPLTMWIWHEHSAGTEYSSEHAQRCLFVVFVSSVQCAPAAVMY